jgi:hypothetical protein
MSFQQVMKSWNFVKQTDFQSYVDLITFQVEYGMYKQDGITNEMQESQRRNQFLMS